MRGRVFSFIEKFSHGFNDGIHDLDPLCSFVWSSTMCVSVFLFRKRWKLKFNDKKEKLSDAMHMQQQQQPPMKKKLFVNMAEMPFSVRFI